MAKKKVVKKMGRPPLPDAVKGGERVGFRASKPWKQWLIEFARFRRKDQADLIDEALEENAVKHRFRKPPKRVGES